MNIKELLDKFNLNLELPDEILSIEIEGDYFDYQKESEDDGEYYYFEDGVHEVIINESDFNECLTYTTVLDNGSSEGVIYNRFGGISAVA